MIGISRIVANRALADASTVYPEFKLAQYYLREILKTFKRAEEPVEMQEMFCDEMKVIANDKHLVAVVKSVEPLTAVYNGMVDVYRKMREKDRHRKELEETLRDKENEFNRKIQKLSQAEPIFEKIKGSRKMVRIHNSMVDLFNHYSRELELYSQAAKPEAGGKEEKKKSEAK